MSDTDLRAKLTADLDTTCWGELRRHAARDAVILVDPAVDLIDVAEAVATDDATRVAAWTAATQLTRPSAAQLRAWEPHHDKPFACVIVAPFVLVQERHRA